MTDQPKTALDQFLAAAKRIEAIHGEVKHARDIPQRNVRIAGAVAIHSTTWSAPEYQRIAEEAATNLRSELSAKYRAAGEFERDAKLSTLAAELQSIRATLPALAAQAAIELGHQSRMLAYEANGGSV